MQIKLPPSIYSSQSLAVAITELKQYASWLDHENVKAQVGTAPASIEPLTVEASTTELMTSWHLGQPATAGTLADLIAALSAVQTGAPQLHITLAAMPSAGLKKQLVEWARAQIHENTLISFEFNSSLLGGMVVRTRSHILDWSFRRHLLAERERFAGILRNV